jgi:hypothetical protein
VEVQLIPMVFFRLHEFSCNKDVNSNDSVKTFAATAKVSNTSVNLWHKR